jgi:hypothetical protein
MSFAHSVVEVKIVGFNVGSSELPKVIFQAVYRERARTALTLKMLPKFARHIPFADSEKFS